MAFDGKQIKDATITAAKLAAGVLSAFLKADGSVLWTGDQDANNVRIKNLGAPQTATDAARLADILATPWKDVCRAATTGNITLSGTQTVDGIALVANDRVLVRAQTDPTENGIYIVAAGAWARSFDADSASELRGATVVIEEGTINADRRFAQTSDSITLGVTAIVFVDIGAGAAAAFPSNANKGMAGLVTTADFQPACATALASTPAGDGYAGASVNGLMVEIGDGVRTKEAYWSDDGGLTAKTLANVASGDQLFWVQTVAGYPLAVTDRIDFYLSV
jgi:hypothetical protein